jgi:DNA-binding response OmpR family regulator
LFITLETEIYALGLQTSVEAMNCGSLTFESAIGHGKYHRSSNKVWSEKRVTTNKTILVQKNGYEIDAAETGKEAMEKADRRHYDLTLVDVRLPDMDGTDLLAKMKKPLQSTIKIMITGFPSLESGVKALDEGADAYLVKPVKPEELLMLIEEKLKTKD